MTQTCCRRSAAADELREPEPAQVAPPFGREAPWVPGRCARRPTGTCCSCATVLAADIVWTAGSVASRARGRHRLDSGLRLGSADSLRPRCDVLLVVQARVSESLPRPNTTRPFGSRPGLARGSNPRKELLTLFAELAAGTGARAYGAPAPSHTGGLPTNAGESRGGEKWTNAGICGHCGAS